MNASEAAGVLLSPVDANLFRRTCAKYATGITVVSLIDADGQPHGLTVNSFTSVSLDPPLVLVCIDVNCTVAQQFRTAAWIGINILSENQRMVSVRFARTCEDRFEGIGWSAGESGVPVLADTIGVLECRVTRVADAGDHIIVMAEVVRAGHREGRPLLYFNSAYQKLS